MESMEGDNANPLPVVANFLQNYNNKDRSVNFSGEDIELLKRLLDKYKATVLCKKTDGSSLKQKEEAWKSIEAQYNANAKVPRNIKQLKYKFETLKKMAKKEAARERQEIRRTGGGKPSPLCPEAKDATDWLSSILSTSIHGNPAIYDDDSLSILNADPNNIGESSQTPKIPDLDHSYTIPLELMDSQTSKKQKLDDASQIIAEFDSTTPHSSLKIPLSQPLKKQIQKKNFARDNNLIKKTLREQKISVLKELNQLELEKIRTSIQNQQEIHEQTMQHNEEKHKLEILKLKLEIDIMNKQKENLKY